VGDWRFEDYRREMLLVADIDGTTSAGINAARYTPPWFQQPGKPAMHPAALFAVDVRL